MAPPPPLIDDVVAEILLRLPPDVPEHLFRAALVCKTWLRIICDPGFRRRYRAFHGAPPLLGLLMVLERDTHVRFASTTSMPLSPHPCCDGWRTRVLDCRHGRVLIQVLHGGFWVSSGTSSRATDTTCPSRTSIGTSTPPRCSAPPKAVTTSTATAAPSASSSFAGRDSYAQNVLDSMLASMYSSETGAWSVPVCLDKTCDFSAQRRHALVVDAVYFTARPASAIVKYDLGKDRLSMFDPPPAPVFFIALMAMENNTSLGFACFQGSSLYTWSRKVESGNRRSCRMGVGLFMIKLNSGQVKKVDESGLYFSVLPYMSFYTPELLLSKS
ncbi:hypothetical protein ACQ4PT_042099 [Festuca glaucescens]